MATGTGSYFKGTSTDQDARFKNKEKKLMHSYKFPPTFDQKIDISKVELGVIKPWISERVTELLGFEDDIVINMVISHLEQQDINHPLCPRKMQINLTGFLERNAAVFMKELWNLLITAQDSHAGIPPTFIEKRKLEMAAKKEQMEKNKEKLKQLNEFIEEKSPVTGEEESKGGRRNVAERRDSSGKYEHRESSNGGNDYRGYRGHRGYDDMPPRLGRREYKSRGYKRYGRGDREQRVHNHDQYDHYVHYDHHVHHHRQHHHHHKHSRGNKWTHSSSPDRSRENEKKPHKREKNQKIQKRGHDEEEQGEIDLDKMLEEKIESELRQKALLSLRKIQMQNVPEGGTFDL